MAREEKSQKFASRNRVKFTLSRIGHLTARLARQVLISPAIYSMRSRITFLLYIPIDGCVSRNSIVCPDYDSVHRRHDRLAQLPCHVDYRLGIISGFGEAEKGKGSLQ